jgi:hypothetical protein
VRRGSGLPWRRRLEERPAHTYAGPEEFERALAGALRGARRGSSLAVYVGSAHVRFTVLPPVQGLKDVAERTAVATSYLQDSLGLSAADWIVTTAAPFTDNIVAAALRRWVYQGVAVQAKQHRIVLRRLQPFAACLRDAHRPAAKPAHALLVEEADALSAFVEADGRVRSASAVVTAAGSTGLDREQERIALAFGIDAGASRVLRVARERGQAALRADFLDLAEVQ